LASWWWPWSSSFCSRCCHTWLVTLLLPRDAAPPCCTNVDTDHATILEGDAPWSWSLAWNKEEEPASNSSFTTFSAATPILFCRQLLMGMIQTTHMSQSSFKLCSQMQKNAGMKDWPDPRHRARVSQVTTTYLC
jgi:hypothetical protein